MFLSRLVIGRLSLKGIYSIHLWLYGSIKSHIPDQDYDIIPISQAKIFPEPIPVAYGRWPDFAMGPLLPRHAGNAVAIAFGFFLIGKGEGWPDGFKLEVVGSSVPVSVEPPPSFAKAPTNLNFDP